MKNDLLFPSRVVWNLLAGLEQSLRHLGSLKLQI